MCWGSKQRVNSFTHALNICSCHNSIYLFFHPALGITDASNLTDDTRLADIGLDSLMVLDIQNVIGQDFGLTLTVAEIENLTLGKLKKMEKKTTMY